MAPIPRGRLGLPRGRLPCDAGSSHRRYQLSTRLRPPLFGAVERRVGLLQQPGQRAVCGVVGRRHHAVDEARGGLQDWEVEHRAGQVAHQVGLSGKAVQHGQPVPGAPGRSGAAGGLGAGRSRVASIPVTAALGRNPPRGTASAASCHMTAECGGVASTWCVRVCKTAPYMTALSQAIPAGRRDRYSSAFPTRSTSPSCSRFPSIRILAASSATPRRSACAAP